jgi:SulP family sulfate permease
MIRDLINPKTIITDSVAGLTLGIESIPDAMASGLLAGVNPIHAVYAVMLATPVGALFASSVFMSVQTTSAMSLIVASVPQVRGDEGMDALFALAILTGIIMLVFGLLKMGSLLRFVPNSVMTGFVNGIAVLIILGQLGDLTGYDTQGANKIAQTIDLFFNLNQVDLPTLMVGIATILLIIVLERTRLKSFGIVVALIVASLLVPLFDWDSVALVGDIAEIPDSLPLPTLPSLAVFPALIIPALSLALVGLVQGAGVSQNYVNPDGNYPDPSGDFVGEGAANIAAGIFQGMPVGGSLSATALVHSSGAKSRFANIFAGITIVVALLLFGGAISALAMPALAGLLIVVGFGTLKIDDITLVWKTGRIQQSVMLITFLFTLLIPLQFAVLIGVALAILLFVFNQSNKIAIKEWI